MPTLGKRLGHGRSAYAHLAERRLAMRPLATMRFADYRQLPVGLVAARVEFGVDGRNAFSEEYSEIQTNPKLDLAIFDPKQFQSEH